MKYLALAPFVAIICSTLLACEKEKNTNLPVPPVVQPFNGETRQYIQYYKREEINGYPYGNSSVYLDSTHHTASIVVGPNWNFMIIDSGDTLMNSSSDSTRFYKEGAGSSGYTTVRLTSDSCLFEQMKFTGGMTSDYTIIQYYRH